jgi:hypothetical protein
MPANVAIIRERLSPTKRLVAYYPDLAEIGGGVTSGIFLSQSLYWTERTDGRGWFFKNREDWKVETGLTRSEQETARRNLRDRGLLTERWGGNPRRLFFRVDLERVIAVLTEHLNPVTISPLAESPPAEKPPAENQPTSWQETSSQVGGNPTSLVARNQPAKTSKTTRDHAETTVETSRAEGEKSPSAKNLASLLMVEILKNKPDYRLIPKQLRDWQTSADQMIRCDNRTEAQIATVIRFAQADSFWKATALSMDSICKNFDQLELKAGRAALLLRHTSNGEAAIGRRPGNGIGADRNLARYTKGLPSAIVARGDEEKMQ